MTSTAAQEPRVHCECCGGTGRRPLTRVMADTLATLTGEWQATDEIKAKLRDRVGLAALCNRLVVLADAGLAERTPLIAVRGYERAGDGRRDLWRRASGSVTS
mgnify:CR=1 FL=1